MTLKQMEYALVTAKCASLSEAAKQLYVSQPSLSEAIKKLEEELGFSIFIRERTGVTVTEAGEEFLSAVQSIVDQVANLEKQYERHNQQTLKTSISVIHYFFMGEVFAELVNRVDDRPIPAYRLRLIDADTQEVLQNVAEGISEVGIISYTDHNKTYIMRELKKSSLDCYEIISTRLFAFLRGGHPLARQGRLTMKDLEPYPYASIWQSMSSQYYFTEEGIFLPANQKKIYVRDCGAMRVLLSETNAFAMGTGVTPSDVNRTETCAVEVEDAPITSICWIRKSGNEISSVAKEFLRICASKLGRSLNI
ncbi:MAG: LysR family transcriptional regulator [Firmicutes bacterium]|nr:LysR family transcriptional regulator [Bacillota bacterium]